MWHYKHFIFKVSLCILLFSHSLSVYAQESNNSTLIDSLLTLFYTNNNSSIKIKAIDSVAHIHEHVDSTLKYAQLELEMVDKNDHPNEYANALRYSAWSYYFKKQHTEAIPLLFDAIETYEVINSKDNLATTQILLANILIELNQYSDANEYYHKALNIYIERNDSTKISETYRLLGHSCVENGMLYQAKNHFYNAMIIDNSLNNDNMLAEDYFYIALYYQKSYEETKTDSLYNIAYNYYHKAISFAKANKQYDRLMRTYCVMSELISIKCYNNSDNISKNELNDISSYIDSATTIYPHYGYINDSIDIKMNEVLYYALKKDFNTAYSQLSSLKNSVYKADVQDISFEINLNFINAIIHELQGNYKKALHYYKEYHNLFNYNDKDLFTVESTQALAKMDYDRMFKKHELAHKAEQKANRLLISLFGVIIIALISISYVIWQNLRKRKSMNKILDEKNQTLALQKDEIQLQNKHLTEQKTKIERQNILLNDSQKQTKESIDYAMHIQKAAIPSENLIYKMFGESFVFFEPLNIISGDFYWASQKEHYKILAVADSTGHGIPGAFMSMLGISILNNICSSIDVNNINAADILNTMRRDLKRSLRQDQQESTNNDGFDIAIVIFDFKNMTIQYAGAFRPLWIVRNNSIIEYRADRMPIGTHLRDHEPFTNHTIKLCHGDNIYLFSDGITDQYGYVNHNIKKYTPKRLREFILKVHNLPMNGQKLAFSKLLHDWKKSPDINHETIKQTDDILIVGIHIRNNS